MIYVIITLDYELFGDGKGDVHHILIEPTSRLIDLLTKYEGVLTIFFDVCEYLAFKEAKKLGKLSHLDYDPTEAIENQLKHALRLGHDVQLHMHPQWLFWIIENNRWILDLNCSRVSDLDYDSFTKVLGIGKRALEDMFRSIVPTYKCIAFRAGDLTIQPEDNILRGLRDTGFLIDSTVAPGQFKEGSLHHYDFRSSPKKPYWRVSTDVTTEDITGALWEIPISTDFMFPWERDIFGKIERRLLEHTKELVSIRGKEGRKRRRQWLQRLIPKYYRLDMSDSFPIIEKFIKRRLKACDEYYAIPLVMIGHSHSIGKLNDLEKFLRKCLELSEAGLATMSSMVNFYRSIASESGEINL